MGAEREFRIKITTDASSAVSGANETSEALNKAGTAVDKASTATEKHTRHIQGMHQAFHALNEVVPGLGALMQAAFSPVGAAISIGVMALRIFQEHLKKVNEELDKMAEENAKPLTNRLEIMREIVIRNAAGMVELGLRISDASRSEHALAKDIDEVISQMRKQAAELQTLGEIRGKGGLVVLENLHQAGLVAEQDYARRRFEIEEGLAQKKRKLAEDELQAEINIRRAGVDAAGQSQPELTAQADRARKQSEAAQTEALVARSGMDTAKENAKTTAEALKKWEDTHKGAYRGRLVDAFQTTGPKGTAADAAGRIITPGEQVALAASGTLDSTTKDIKKQFDEWQMLKLAADASDKAMKAAPNLVAKREVEAATAQDAYKRASEDAVDNARLMTKTKQEVNQKERELAELRESNQELASAEHNASRLSQPMGVLATQDLGAAVTTALKFMDTVEMYRARHPGVDPTAARLAVNQERHLPVSADELRKMTDLATRIQGHQTGRGEALLILGKAAQDTRAFTDDVGKLVRVMENLTRNIGPIRGRIDELEKQVRGLEGTSPRVY